MKDGQSNYLNMTNAVLQHFDDNASAWNGIPVVVTGLERLKKTGAAIRDAATKQKNNNPTGHTAAKERSRDKLENLTYRVAVRVRSYSRATDNDVLTEKLIFSRSALDRMKHNDLLTCSRVVLNTCNEYLPSLSDYQVDQTVVDELAQSIEQTAQLFAERDIVVDQRMEATSDLTNLFTTARDQLKVLDDLVEGYVDDDAFVATYFNARRIHDLKGRGKRKEEE
jgi:lysyl-tRNA synthetase class I